MIINKTKLFIGLVLFPIGWYYGYNNDYFSITHFLCNLAFLISVYLIVNSIKEEIE